MTDKIEIEELRNLALMAQNFMDDVLPQMAKICIQDYASLNQLCMALTKEKLRREVRQQEAEKPPVLLKVVSGGQTGADMGGLLAAKDSGVATGGWAPKGYRTEGGGMYKELRQFGLQEHHREDYTGRTQQNIKDADLTLIFVGDELSSGSKMTREICQRMRKPYGVCNIGSPFLGQQLYDVVRKVAWARGVADAWPMIINVAGNRESVYLGIQEEVRKIMNTHLPEILNILKEAHGISAESV